MVETLGEVMPYAARRYGGKTALVSDGARFTFSDLEAKSNAFANGLVATGIKPGETVTLYGPNSWQWLVAYYAVAKTGAVVNPVNVMLTPEEVKFIVGDCGARAVVASADKAAALMDMREQPPKTPGDVSRMLPSAPQCAQCFTAMKLCCVEPPRDES